MVLWLTSSESKDALLVYIASVNSEGLSVSGIQGTPQSFELQW